MSQKNKPVVAVAVKSFSRLKLLKYPLTLDSYQRPFVWDSKKVQQLIDDLLEYQRQDATAPNYYMGTLLLHRNDDKQCYFVIDGQQRLTSLSVLHYVLKGGSLPKNIEFSYKSAISAKNIQKAKALFAKSAVGKILKQTLSRLEFTVITVDREDLAFTFFDTQNNRGVPLKATDLLKAFHLRAITSEDSIKDEQLQELCAKRWEHVQVKGEAGKQNRSNDFAPELFHYYLWRARNWKGKTVERELHDDVIDTFQAQSIRCTAVDSVTLYPSVGNAFAGSMQLLINDDYRLLPQPLDVSHHAAKLPFTLRQPIHQGVGFFLYAQKYASLINMLLHDENPETEVADFRNFYFSVVCQLSHYLRELYKLAVLMYVDQFGCQQLLRFALHLDHVLGAIRLDKAYIFKEAPLKYLKESAQNLLDIIAGAYRPEEVIDFLKSDQWANEVYASGKVAKIEREKGVQGKYLEALMTYYNKAILEDKHEWMDATITVGA
tara:strand:- start:2195 stop:3664 length:1470 start_codon:yes stop_codon:yes gene_type:complete